MKTRLHMTGVGILTICLGWSLNVLSAPNLESSTTATGGSSTIIVARPDGTAAGDLLVAALTFNGGSKVELTTPSGWTLLRRSNSHIFIGMATYYRVAGDSEPIAYSFETADPAEWSAGVCRISGADTADPIIASSRETGKSGDVTAVSVDTDRSDALVLAFFSNRKNTTFIPDPATTEQYDVPNIPDGLPSNMLATFPQARAGATGNKTAVPAASDRWVAQQVAVAASAAAPEPPPEPVDLSAFSVQADTVAPIAGEVVTLSITGAQDVDGTLLNGSVISVIEDSTDEISFGDTLDFINGNATVAMSLLAVATHSLTITVDGVTNPETLDITVHRRPITLTADSGQSKLLNDPDPELTYSLSSGELIAGIELSGTPEREPGEDPGLYAILQGALTDAENPSYQITFISADFEITEPEPAPPEPTVPAVPTVESVSTTSGAGSSITIAKPDGTAAGDLLVASLMLDGGDPIDVTAPDGWTLIRRCNSFIYIGVATYYRVAESSEPSSYTFVLNQSTPWAAGISRISGADTASPIVDSSRNTGRSGDVTALSIDDTRTNTLVLAFFSNLSSATYTPPPSTVEKYDAPNTAAGTPSHMLAAMNKSNSGATGDLTAAPTASGRWAAQQVVIAGADKTIPDDETGAEPVDLSGFIAQTIGTPVAGDRLILEISGARDTSGNLINGLASSTVMSSLDNIIYSDGMFFIDGTASVSAPLITAGTHTLTITVSSITNPQTLTIYVARRAITLSADTGLSKVEGEADPALTFSVTAGSLSSSIPLVGNPARDSGETAGFYTIRQGTLTDANNPNYAITFITADFEIIALASSGIWTSAEELAALPMSGTAWDNLKSKADQPLGYPNLSDQEDTVNVYAMAKALVYARTGIESYRTDVIEACMRAINTEDGGRTLALGRNLGAFVIAADLVGLPPAEDAVFREWLRDTLTDSNMTEGRYLIWTHENRPNNWGTHAGGARVAVAVYLNDQEELARCAQVFKGWLGDRSSYAGFSYGDLWWQSDPSNPVGINPKGATIKGYNVDGVLPDDQRRGGAFTWPPPQENYVYEALQGALMQAVILYRAGYDVWNWEDQALLRAFTWLHEVNNYPAEGDDTWQPYIVNYYYGKSFPTVMPSRPGKNVGWTCWTHQ